MTKTQRAMMIVDFKNNVREPIRSFRDWEKYSLPPERQDHWKEGRSACELGRIWTANGKPAVPGELTRLLESNEGTQDIVIHSGITEHETRLPFAQGGRGVTTSPFKPIKMAHP